MDSRYGERRLTLRQAEEILARAIEMEGELEEPRLSLADLDLIAREVGLSPISLRAAVEVDHVRTVSQPGAPVITCEALTSRPASRVTNDLISRLERMHLRRERTGNGSRWRQHSGWWPDVHRFVGAPVVTTTVEEWDVGTRHIVRLTATADVRYAAREHVAGAAAGIGVIVGIAAATLAPVAILLSLAASAGVAAAAAGAYRRRLVAIEARLTGLVTDVASRGGSMPSTSAVH